jgi:hypothetical protein
VTEHKALNSTYLVGSHKSFLLIFSQHLGTGERSRCEASGYCAVHLELSIDRVSTIGDFTLPGNFGPISSVREANTTSCF